MILSAHLSGSLSKKNMDQLHPPIVFYGNGDDLFLSYSNVRCSRS